MVSQNQSVLTDKGTNKLLGDTVGSPLPLEMRMARVRQRVLDRVGANHDVRVSYAQDNDGCGFVVTIVVPGGQRLSAYDVDMTKAAMETLNKWHEERRRQEIAERVEREMQLAAKIDAADLLTGEIFTDNGDATTGTLPLCKFGQGDFTREVQG